MIPVKVLTIIMPIVIKILLILVQIKQEEDGMRTEDQPRVELGKGSS